LLGEVLVVGESSGFDMPWHVATLNGCKKCRGEERKENKKLERVRMRV
jgi:hypothetical protein